MSGPSHTKAPRNGGAVKLGRSPITGQNVWKPVAKRGGTVSAAKIRDAVHKVVASRER